MSLQLSRSFSLSSFRCSHYHRIPNTSSRLELTLFVTHTKLDHTSVSNTDPPTPLAAKAFQNRHMFLGKNNHKDDCLYLHTSIGVKVITL